MKKLIALLVLGAAAGLGCSNNTVFVRALQAPKWPVEGARSIAVISVLEGKHGREAQLTRDLGAAITTMLKKSAYYTLVKSRELPAGEFERGTSGELVPVEPTISELLKELGVELLLFVEVLHSEMTTRIDSQIGYSVGFGTMHRHSAFGTSIGTGSSYWTVRAQMLAALALGRAGETPITAKTVRGHSFRRSFSDVLPSESDIFRQLVGRAGMQAITNVDVFFHPSPRYLRSDGTQLVREGIRHALGGTQRDWEAAEHLWSRALDANPASLAARYNIGVAAEMREDYDGAVSFYDAARSLTGTADAFEREIREASQSAEILAVFGPPTETGDQGSETRPETPPAKEDAPPQEPPEEPSGE